MERITLQIEGLPQVVDVGGTYQYYIRLRNDETHSVTVMLKSNQSDLVYGVTVPASSYEDVEVTSEFEDAGNLTLTYTVMKSSEELDSISQTVKVKKHNSVNEPGCGSSLLALLGSAVVFLIFFSIFGIFVHDDPFFWTKGWNDSTSVETIPAPAPEVDEEKPLTKNVVVEGAIVCGGDWHQITLVDNADAVNPTYDQLLSFLKMDMTDKHPYTSGSYICADFAETLHNNAEKAGIRAAYVSVNINHALNAFETTDKGVIYIDDGGLDTIAHVIIGDKYTLELIWPGDRSRLASVSVNVGIVESVQIDW